MKNILAPVDFSPASRNAENYAARLARVFGARLYLLHVYRDLMPPIVGPEPWTVVVSDTRVEKEKLINREISYLNSKYAFDIQWAVESGSRTKTIVDVAKDTESDLIVMGISSKKRNRILGSTVFRTILKTKLPVLIVPEEAQFLPIKNIVVAVDDTEIHDGSCFDVLFEVYQKFNPALRVLHIGRPGGGLKNSDVPPELQLEKALSRFSFQYNRIESSNAEDAIQDYTEKHSSDLLVLVAHYHPVEEHIFGTIHTRALSLQMKLPLLVIRNRQ